MRAEDFLTWTPLSYAEHFIASNFKARDLAIEAMNPPTQRCALSSTISPTR